MARAPEIKFPRRGYSKSGFSALGRPRGSRRALNYVSTGKDLSAATYLLNRICVSTSKDLNVTTDLLSRIYASAGTDLSATTNLFSRIYASTDKDLSAMR